MNPLQQVIQENENNRRFSKLSTREFYKNNKKQSGRFTLNIDVPNELDNDDKIKRLLENRRFVREPREYYRNNTRQSNRFKLDIDVTKDLNNKKTNNNNVDQSLIPNNRRFTKLPREFYRNKRQSSKFTLNIDVPNELDNSSDEDNEEEEEFGGYDYELVESNSSGINVSEINEFNAVGSYIDTNDDCYDYELVESISRGMNVLEINEFDTIGNFIEEFLNVLEDDNIFKDKIRYFQKEIEIRLTKQSKCKQLQDELHKVASKRKLVCERLSNERKSYEIEEKERKALAESVRMERGDVTNNDNRNHIELGEIVGHVIKITNVSGDNLSYGNDEGYLSIIKRFNGLLEDFQTILEDN
ncbi:7106_t:CDS:2 [Entrophospora sp. SA101]|nr:7106_t:CDS:2 [Entrophospora sp. SA101]